MQNVNLKDDVKIKVIERLYNQKFKNYIYYHWIQQSIYKSYKITTLKKNKYQLTPINCTLQFVPIICTNTFNVNLKWDDFFYFRALITSFTKLKYYALETYPNLTSFLYSWFLFKKEKTF
jgi:hypothetical protein